MYHIFSSNRSAFKISYLFAHSAAFFACVADGIAFDYADMQKDIAGVLTSYSAVYGVAFGKVRQKLCGCFCHSPLIAWRYSETLKINSFALA